MQSRDSQRWLQQLDDFAVGEGAVVERNVGMNNVAQRPAGGAVADNQDVVEGQCPQEVIGHLHPPEQGVGCLDINKAVDVGVRPPGCALELAEVPLDEEAVQ